MRLDTYDETLAEFWTVVDLYKRTEPHIMTPVNCDGPVYGDGYYPPYVAMIRRGDDGQNYLGKVTFVWPQVQDLPGMNDPEWASEAMLRQQVQALRVAMCPTIEGACELATEYGADRYREEDD